MRNLHTISPQISDKTIAALWKASVDWVYAYKSITLKNNTDIEVVMNDSAHNHFNYEESDKDFCYESWIKEGKPAPDWSKIEKL